MGGMNFFDASIAFPSTSSSDSDTSDASHTQEPPKKRRRELSRETSAERTETAICPQKEAGRGYGVPPERRRVVDDMGRVRRYPHVEGRFASLIYIPISCPDDRKTQIEELLSQLNKELHTEVHSLIPVGEKGVGISHLHASLSRSFTLEFHEIDAFLSILQKRLKKYRTGVKVEMGRYESFANEEGDRTFLSSVLASETDTLRSMLHTVDIVLQLHRKEPFYPDPRLHVSVAWMRGDRREELKPLLQESHTGRESSLPSWKQQVEHIFCRIGQKDHVVWTCPSIDASPNAHQSEERAQRGW